MPPADLTPAIDKYTRLPEKEFYAQYKSLHNKSPLWMSSNSQSPEGPDPFSLVHDELKSLSDYVKEMVAAENPVLTMAASHFFQQVCSLSYVHFFYSVVTVYFFNSGKGSASVQLLLPCLAALFLALRYILILAVNLINDSCN